MSGDQQQRLTSGKSDAIPRIWDSYRYRDRIPPRGLLVDGRPAFTGIEPDRVGRYVVISVRDPLGGSMESHARDLAGAFGSPEQAGSTALFQTWTASLQGEAVTVIATGSGGPEIELALHELTTHTGADTFLFFGTAAGLHPKVRPGDVVISAGAVRDEGMTQAHVRQSFPALAAYDVVSALAGAGNELGVSFHVGVTRSSDSDTVGVGRPGIDGYMQPEHADLIDYYVRAGVLSNDREVSAVLTLATLSGRRGGAVLGVTDNHTIGEQLQPGAGSAEARAVLRRGLQRLIEFDGDSARLGRRYWSLSD